MDTVASMSAVTVVVPAALPALAAHRHLDRAAIWGVAPHVTSATLPYGGEFGEPVPHLTVGHVPYATADELRAAERGHAPALAVRSVVDHVDVLIGRDAPDSWHSVARLPLG